MPNLNEQVIDDFRANQGRVGGPYEGARIMLVHHVGAKTGARRVTPMSYFPQEDGSMVVVASNRGASTNPAWYVNLMARPRTDVEVGAETFSVVVEEITGTERDAVWADVVAVIPAVLDYQKKTNRTIPLLRLTRVD
ncbi:nitroreductase family deazaflavin-dependent oxidoreductase [Amycolatopsis sp. RM579]|uniref:Nitroreductase family deazaflavin-dependent oxidoreductase n=1 Tax=Amycolatopsis pithecellobii TaxID=664692 RepID=A0A6N7Z2K8_9PSEU|nr:nitroreductase family deazaflavin-dependent oxidoreductase [Amycolatopsis pithecellobii]